MDTIEHLRDVPSLRHLRGLRAAVVVCLDDPSSFETRRDEIRALDAELFVEREPGELSARLGRPSVTVSDRWLEVAERAEDMAPDDAIKRVRWLEMRCEECTQSGVDMALRPSADD